MIAIDIKTTGSVAYIELFKQFPYMMMMMMAAFDYIQMNNVFYYKFFRIKIDESVHDSFTTHYLPSEAKWKRVKFLLSGDWFIK